MNILYILYWSLNYLFKFLLRNDPTKGMTTYLWISSNIGVITLNPSYKTASEWLLLNIILLLVVKHYSILHVILCYKAASQNGADIHQSNHGLIQI